MKKKGTRRCLHPIHKVTHNPIPPSLFLQDHNMQAIGCQDVVLLPRAFITNKQHVKAKQRCRDGVMSDFVYWCRHLLVPFFFMK